MSSASLELARPTIEKRRMRKDARLNREKLLAAASALMRTEGDVPMEVICERAGVTRKTLYRNFPHRQAIYEAVLEQDMAGLAARIAEDADDPLAFIRHTTELTAVYAKFLDHLVDMADYDAGKNQRYMAEMLTPALRNAQAKGLLRADLTGADILMACRMLASNWRLDNCGDSDASFARRMALIMRGLG